jgi:hypothetical protein
LPSPDLHDLTLLARNDEQDALGQCRTAPSSIVGNLVYLLKFDPADKFSEIKVLFDDSGATEWFLGASRAAASLTRLCARVGTLERKTRG